jgi:acylphosphatase
MNWVRKRLLISGRVQGVAFRAYTRSAARKIGAYGWVRNLSDGRVEAVIEGEPDKVEALVQWCRKGPPSGRVDNVNIREEEPTREFSDFEIAYTGGDFW